MSVIYRSYLRLTVLAFILWGMSAASMHVHDMHSEAQNAPCDVCLIMKSGDQHSAAIALPASEFILFTLPSRPEVYAGLSSEDFTATPVRGPPKRGPPTVF